MKCPPDLFRKLESIVAKTPSRLDLTHYHSINQREVTDADQILSAHVNHCLIGWVIALTPGAARMEARREASGCDPIEFANDILVSSGRLPIPLAIPFSDEVSAIKFIRGRAAEERQQELLVSYAVN